MMSVLDKRVEATIEQAQRRGEFDQLPGAGKPLDLSDDALIPEELRLGYRILKNAGFVPPQVSLLREAASLRATLASACDELSGPEDVTRRRLQRRLVAVSVALDAHGVDLSTVAGGAYYQRAIQKLVAQ